MQSMATVFDTPFLSILTALFCTLIFQYSLNVLDLSLLYSFSAMASVVEFNKTRKILLL